MASAQLRPVARAFARRVRHPAAWERIEERRTGRETK